MATTEASLAQSIEEQSVLVTKLKADNADAVSIEDARKRLAELKKSLNLLKLAATSGKDTGKKKERLLLKTAKVRKGFVCMDFWPNCSSGHARLWTKRDVL